MTASTTNAPVRVEVKFFGGGGHRGRFATIGQATAWLATDAFTARAHRVRSVVIVAPRPAPDSEDQAQAQPSPASRWRERVLSGAAA